MVAPNFVIFPATIVPLFPSARATAPDRRAITVASFVVAVKTVDQHLARPADEAVVYVRPSGGVARGVNLAKPTRTHGGPV